MGPNKKNRFIPKKIDRKNIFSKNQKNRPCISEDDQSKGIF
jgi:hypothetical protein